MASSLLFIPWWILLSGEFVASYLLSLWWIPLSGKFVASYLLVDSFSGKVGTYSSITSTHLIIFFF